MSCTEILPQRFEERLGSVVGQESHGGVRPDADTHRRAHFLEGLEELLCDRRVSLGAVQYVVLHGHGRDECTASHVTAPVSFLSLVAQLCVCVGERGSK